MSGTAYRPKNYYDVLGSEQAVTLLKSIVVSRKIPNAMTITGPAGTGKTTLGRIYSKALLCHEPLPDGSACDTCPSCKAMDSESNPNYLEVDAASYGNKDFVKSLVEKTRHELESRIVVLFDEAQEITPEGKDALLKVLEEENTSDSVVFIFCTNEIHKMPKPLIQRGFMVVVPPTPKPHLVIKLRHICTQSGTPFTEEGLSLLADCFEGSFRQAENAIPVLKAMGGVTEDSVCDIAPVSLLDAADMLDALTVNIRAAMDYMDKMAARADAKSIRDMVLKVLVDVMKVQHGVSSFKGGYDLTIRHLADKYESNVMVLIKELTDSSAFSSLPLLQTHLLSLHYKFLYGKVESAPEVKVAKVTDKPAIPKIPEDQKEKANTFFAPVRTRGAAVDNAEKPEQTTEREERKLGPTISR
jgi:DNA polymerase III subunit gamma/tau